MPKTLGSIPSIIINKWTNQKIFIFKKGGWEKKIPWVGDTVSSLDNEKILSMSKAEADVLKALKRFCF